MLRESGRRRRRVGSPARHPRLGAAFPFLPGEGHECRSPRAARPPASSAQRGFDITAGQPRGRAAAAAAERQRAAGMGAPRHAPRVHKRHQPVSQQMVPCLGGGRLVVIVHVGAQGVTVELVVRLRPRQAGGTGGAGGRRGVTAFARTSARSAAPEPCRTARRLRPAAGQGQALMATDKLPPGGGIEVPERSSLASLCLLHLRSARDVRSLPTTARLPCPATAARVSACAPPTISKFRSSLPLAVRRCTATSRTRSRMGSEAMACTCGPGVRQLGGWVGGN